MATSVEYASYCVATRQLLVYFQAKDALGKGQGYLGSNVRPEDTKDLQNTLEIVRNCTTPAIKQMRNCH